MDEDENKMKEREPRNSTQCSSNSMETRMECGECMCLSLFCSPQNKDVSRSFVRFMCMCVFFCCCLYLWLPHVYVFFSFFHSATKRNSGKNLTKCVFLFISSGYNIVTSIWWEFLFLVGWAKKKKGTQNTLCSMNMCIMHMDHLWNRHTVSGKKNRKEMRCLADEKKSVRSLVDITDNRCRLFTATKEQKLHIKCSML